MTAMATSKRGRDETAAARLAAANELSRAADPLERRRAQEVAATLGRAAADVAWRGLTDPDTLVRETAIRTAAEVVSPLRLLDGVASEANSVLRTACIEALKRKGPAALPALRKGIQSSDQDLILFSLQILGSLGEEAAPLLVPFLKHEDLNIAQAAIDGLGELRSRQAVGPLLELLNGDIWLRFAAVLALGKIGDSRATLDLLALIDDETTGAVALDALGQIGDPSAVPGLCRALATEDRYPQRDSILLAVASCLGADAHPPEIEPEIAQALEGEGLGRYLAETVRSPRPPLRAAANRLIRALAPGSVRSALVEHLDDPALSGATVSWYAALPAAAGAQSILTAAVRHERPLVRASAYRVLGGRPEAWGETLLFDGLKDADPDALASVVRALARRRAVGAFPRLLPLLFHESETVRTRTLEALPSLARPEDVETVRERVRDAQAHDELVSFVELSRRLDSSRFADLWIERLANAPADLLRVLLRALGEAGDVAARPHILPFLEHPSSAVRTLAVESLSQLPAGEELGRELHRRLLVDRECTYALVKALGRLGYAPAAKDLEALYERAAPLEKVAVLEALGEIGTPHAAQFLKHELDSRDRERRRAAATALARHFLAPNVALFRRLARSDDWALRNTAAWALGEARLPESVAVLERLVEDPEEVVARTARAALEKIETPEAP